MIGTVEAASHDRLMARARIEAAPGGIAGAIERYRKTASPDLILLQTSLEREPMFAALEGLAEVCDINTKVALIGDANDITLYKTLIDNGVEEYIVGPVDAARLIEVLSGIYKASGNAKTSGKLFAFVGAKGGVGASVLCHNVAWSLAQMVESNIVLADLDLPFGSASFNFDIAPTKGIADVIDYGKQLDDALLEKLLFNYRDELSILASPGKLDRGADLAADVFHPLFDLARRQFPYTILDIPHAWGDWTKSALIAADQVIVVAEPDLANLKGAKSMVDFLKASRPNDAFPRLVMNRTGVPKRPEVDPREFAKALGVDALATVAFDPSCFGTATNNGQPIGEACPKSLTAETIYDIAEALFRSGDRTALPPRKRSLLRRLVGGGTPSKRRRTKS